MQASQDEGDLCPPTSRSPQSQGFPSRSREVEGTYVHKPGWAQVVGQGQMTGAHERIELQDFTILRVELHDFRLSHAGALFLLQGASLKQLFSDVVVRVGDRDPDVYSLAVADAPQLFLPPPRVPRVVLAHILERPASMPPEKVFEQLFMSEMARASSF